MGETKILNVKIGGMHCGSCINHIENVLKPLGATKVSIDLANALGHIRFEDDDILADVFLDAIEDAGYSAEKRSLIDAEALN